MFEIIFLGTSASAPSIYRGLPAQVVLAGEHRFMIDCGEGTQRQILRSGLGFKKLNKILLTHAHLDHILGLGGLVSTFAHWETESIDQIEIFGGRATLDRVHALLFGAVLQYERLKIEIKLTELKPGIIFTSKEYTISAFPVTHRGYGNFGFIFQEKARRPFLVEQAEALGIPAGPERGRLVSGQIVTLDDGRTISPDMVLGAMTPGAKFVYVGDTGRTDNLREVVQNADTLVIESTFLDQDADSAKSFGHITAQQAAELAASSGVGSLILTHVSRRYRESAVIEEARRTFPNTFVARDFDHYAMKAGQLAVKVVPEPRQPAVSGADVEPDADDSAGNDE